MALTEYRRKRDFRKTAEPRGAKQPRSKKKLSFVIQKHDASHLHYDFRLEFEGVLKSWAVPKGPSLDPSQKRLAVAVEDHPLEYGGFEGTIPAGQYGGGTVMLWDRGSWEPLGDPAEDFASGKLKFRLFGEKLSGGWMLLRTGGRGRDPRQWLLFKERDEAARPHEEYDVLEEQPLSVSTHRDLDEIARAGDREWHSNTSDGHPEGEKKAAVKKSAGTKTKAESPKAARTTKKASGSSKLKALPKVVKPQLATLVEKAPAGEEWLHEIKFDGYRILAYVDDGEARLTSRNDLDWTGKFSKLAEAVGKLSVRQAIFDGEVVVHDEHGVTSFQALQEALHDDRQGALVYYVFDLLWLDGQDLRPLSLAERKARLAALKLPKARGLVRDSDCVQGGGPAFFAEAQRLGLEGIISKRADRPHVAGRSSDWLKIKCSADSEFVIGGLTRPQGSRQGFGALLLGTYDDAGKLKYAGRVGTGFNDKLLGELSKRLRALEVGKSPFADAKIPGQKSVRWVRPSLVAQIRYSNWTRDGMLRHPAFLGLREDKPARSVHREVEQPLAKVAPVKKAKGGAKAAKTKPRGKAHDPAPPSHQANGKADATIAGQRLTHPEKVLYPDDGFTKRDLAEYYLAVAETMLPHVTNRPLSVVRCPDGLNGQRFFQKHPSAGMLESLEKVSVKESGGRADYVVIRQAADLVALVQVGALELHTWGSRADAIERPDQLIFDLDPAPDVTWKRVIEATRQIHDFLAEVGLESFVKTSGGKGLHLVVPIERRHEWPYVAAFARAVAAAIAHAAPKDFVDNMSKAKRHGKIFVDYLRNQRGATAVAPFSTRARPGAPVAMPLAWSELASLQSADRYTIANAPRRLSGLKADPWAEMLTVRQSLTAKMLKQIEA